MSEVDPRSRGGDVAGRRVQIPVYGRSPLTRGRRARHQFALGPVRSIPAHAGETIFHFSVSPLNKVDPRSRGGDDPVGVWGGGNEGRSPLTRGRLAVGGILHITQRSIPAHAGETPWSRLPVRRMAVDPRSRGGDRCTCYPLSPPRGRSPLTRGRRYHALFLPRICGSIPAHAGETFYHHQPIFCARVDPRSRGGDSAKPHGAMTKAGRSPLTRGRL